MRMTCRIGKTVGSLFSAAVLLSAFLIPLSAWAKVTNAVPYTDSFEDYTNGALLVEIPETSWDGAQDAMAVATAPQPYLGQKPLFNQHTNLVHITAPVTNMISDPAGNSEHANWVDMLIQPRRWMEAERPTFPDDSQVVVYFDSNGVINAYCSIIVDPIGGTTTNGWADFGQASVPTGQWIRLTIGMYYNSNGEDYFQIRLNNSDNLSSPYGQTSPGAYDTGGSWFLCGNFTKNESSMYMFKGDFFLDDFLVTNGMPSIKPQRTVRVIADTGATVVPGGVGPTTMDVPVEDGANADFSILSQLGYQITNVAWGVGLGAEYLTDYVGPTNSWTFPSVGTDYTIRASADRLYVDLAISSTFDGAQGVPYVFNTNTYPYGQLILCAITNSPAPFDDGLWTQMLCTGWINGYGSVAGSGSSSNVSFTITQPSGLTWNWTPRYKLLAQVSGNGRITPVAGSYWYTNNALVRITATSSWGVVFTAWTGDTDGSTIVNNDILVPMDKARTVQANFQDELNAPLGTEIAWLRKYGLTNFPSSAQSEQADPDLDSKKTWEEYFTGTVPTNRLSVFMVLSGSFQGASNYVSFFGTTNSGVTTPFGMRRGTLSGEDITWTLLPASIDRAGDGTNQWWDELPPAGGALYLPIWTNAP